MVWSWNSVSPARSARSIALALACWLVTLAVPLPVYAAGIVDVVEYQNAALDHYFVTADTAEIAALDSGALGGVWKRTGGTFTAWSAVDAPAGTVGACRFFGTDRYRFDGTRIGPNSHFYTADPGECEFVKNAWPALADDGRSYPAWSFESYAFAVRVPMAGVCPAGTKVIYRAYNNSAGGTPNHRITTSTTAIDEVFARGWTPEGKVMCAPVLGAINEIEDNDTRERATPASFNRELRGSLSTLTDEDWYYFDLSSNLNYYVDVSFDVSSMTSGVWGVSWYGPVEDYSSELMWLSIRNLSPPSFDYFFPTWRAGRYYLRVSPVVNATGPTAFLWNNGSYVVRTSIRPAPTVSGGPPQF